MNRDTDLLIIGAGPAGMAAASEARVHGLRVTLVDEQPEAGGQIYRSIRSNVQHAPARVAMLGPDYGAGAELVAEFHRSGAEHLAGATLWDLEDEGVAHVLHGGRSITLRARHVLAATGALERAMPIPGWTLPGVLSAGGAQILLKTRGIVPDAPPVLCGSGPLIALLAWQYLRAGVRVAAIVETAPRQALAGLLWRPRELPAAAGYLAKGLRMLAAITRHGVTVHRGATAVRVIGDVAARGLQFVCGGREHAIASPLVVLHDGVIPNVQLTRALGCEHDWDPIGQAWRPRVDGGGRTSLPWFSVAGDGAGIGGAQAARRAGTVAAANIACALGAIDASQRDARIGAERRWLARNALARVLLDRLFPSGGHWRAPADETVVCRCEDITAGQVRAVAALGCPGPNQMKAFLRCGMGPCQGRTCGPTVASLIAQVRGVGMEDAGHYRIRFPIKPVRVDQIAGLGDTGGVDARVENVLV